MEHIFLVEDDSSILKELTEFLSAEGYTLSTASTKADALRIIDEKTFDLILLDVSLPDGNGFSICSAIKAKHDTPVIFLTASDDEYSVVTGLDLGADDYIGKPFRPRELISRIKSVLRRYSKAGTVIDLGSICIDTDKGNVTKDGDVLFLSALEYRLLLIFLNNRGQTLSRDQLLEELWDVDENFVSDNTLTVYIKRLREKIENDPSEPEIIKTVRGLGYRMD